MTHLSQMVLVTVGVVGIGVGVGLLVWSAVVMARVLRDVRRGKL